MWMEQSNCKLNNFFFFFKTGREITASSNLCYKRKIFIRTGGGGSTPPLPFPSPPRPHRVVFFSLFFFVPAAAGFPFLFINIFSLKINLFFLGQPVMI